MLERAKGTRGHVYRYLQGRGDFGATDEEMQEHLGMSPNTQRPRRCELVNMGVVVATSRRRKTRSDFDAVVWVAEQGDPTYTMPAKHRSAYIKDLENTIMEYDELLALQRTRMGALEELWRSATGASSLVYPDLGVLCEWAAGMIRRQMQPLDTRLEISEYEDEFTLTP
jgi:hypothetical protein